MMFAMKKIVVCTGIAAAALAAWAAVPVEFKVETDHADCLYRCGEQASFTVTVTGPGGQKLAAGSFNAKLDNFGEKVLAEKRVDLAQGNPFTVAAVKDTPGFMRLSLDADAQAFTLPKTAGQGAFHWGVAYEPEKIRPGAENPADFDSFWADAFRKLDEKVPEDARLEKIGAKSTAGHTYYRISFASHGGRRVWGWLNMPAGKGPFPVRVNVPGAGIGAKGTGVSDKEITLTMNVHSYPQPDADAARQAAYKAQDEKYAAPCGVARYCQAGIHISREDYFYYASLLGINRAVNWLWRQPQTDRRNFTYSGTSQGGGFGFMLTGLNGHFTKSCIFVPPERLASHHRGAEAREPRRRREERALFRRRQLRRADHLPRARGRGLCGLRLRPGWRLRRLQPHSLQGQEDHTRHRHGTPRLPPVLQRARQVAALADLTREQQLDVICRTCHKVL